MMQITSKKSTAWAKHMKDQAQSNVTQRAYCKTHGLTLTQFYYWRRRLASGTAAKPAERKPRSVSPGGTGFVPVKLAPSPSYQSLLITLPSGILISGIDDGNQHLVASVIGACK